MTVQWGHCVLGNCIFKLLEGGLLGWPRRRRICEVEDVLREAQVRVFRVLRIGAHLDAIQVEVG